MSEWNIHAAASKSQAKVPVTDDNFKEVLQFMNDKPKYTCGHLKLYEKYCDFCEH